MISHDPVACHAALSMEFSRQEYWSGLPFPFPGDLPDPLIEPGSLSLQAASLQSEPLRKPIYIYAMNIIGHQNERRNATGSSMDGPIFMLSEVSHTEKDNYHMTAFICGI